MIIALASPRVASSTEEGLDKIKQSLAETAAQGAEIVCFPEAYLPGLRGLDFAVPPFTRTSRTSAACACGPGLAAAGRSRTRNRNLSAAIASR